MFKKLYESLIKKIRDVLDVPDSKNVFDLDMDNPAARWIPLDPYGNEAILADDFKASVRDLIVMNESQRELYVKIIEDCNQFEEAGTTAVVVYNTINRTVHVTSRERLEGMFKQ